MRYYGYNNAKEVSYAQLTGNPGLTFRSGRTMLSYQWSSIAPASPTAQELEPSLKVDVLYYCPINLACYLCGATLKFYLYLVKRTVCLMLFVTCCVAGGAPDVHAFCSCWLPLEIIHWMSLLSVKAFITAVLYNLYTYLC